MPKENPSVNKIRVVCQTADFSKHYRWCHSESVSTTDDYQERKGEATYTRVFQDADDVKFFKLDNGIPQ